MFERLAYAISIWFAIPAAILIVARAIWGKAPLVRLRCLLLPWERELIPELYSHLAASLRSGVSLSDSLADFIGDGGPSWFVRSLSRVREALLSGASLSAAAAFAPAIFSAHDRATLAAAEKSQTLPQSLDRLAEQAPAQRPIVPVLVIALEIMIGVVAARPFLVEIEVWSGAGGRSSSLEEALPPSLIRLATGLEGPSVWFLLIPIAAFFVIAGAWARAVARRDITLPRFLLPRRNGKRFSRGLTSWAFLLYALAYIFVPLLIGWYSAATRLRMLVTPEAGEYLIAPVIFAVLWLMMLLYAGVRILLAAIAPGQEEGAL